MSATIFTFITHNQNYHHVCVWGFWRRRVACGDYSTNCCSTVTNEHGEKLHHRAMATYSKGVYIPISKYIERDYLFRGTRRCKKRVRSLSYIHFWRQTHSTSGEWTEQVVDVEVVPLLILKHGWWWGQCLVERGISANQLEAFFLYRLMKIIVECCRMISWLDLQRSF